MKEKNLSQTVRFFVFSSFVSHSNFFIRSNNFNVLLIWKKNQNKMEKRKHLENKILREETFRRLAKKETCNL